MTGVIFVNPASGPDDDTAHAVRDLFPDAEVREISGDELPDQAARAARSEADFVGMAGGDGSIRCVASALVGTAIPLLAIPGGTKNHFARALGLPTYADAAQAVNAGTLCQVDLGEVNGQHFVNNASIGVYPKLVRHRERLESRLPKRLATMVAAWPQARHLHRVAITIDGTQDEQAWMVFVGNGQYGTSAFQATERAALDEGVLDLRVCRADVPWARARAVVALLTGRLDTSPIVTRDTARSFQVATVGAIDVALDGEVMTLTSPLCFRSLPRALTVFCGPDLPVSE